MKSSNYERWYLIGVIAFYACSGSGTPSNTSTPTSSPLPTLTATAAPTETATAMPTAAADLRAPGPWTRTETREACTRYSVLRDPYFGDLHVHTGLSADAYIYGTRVGPDDAYAFARGSEITVSDDNEIQSRHASIDRPLDFTAVTDHSEWFGEVKICIDPTSPVYDEHLCSLLRQAESPDDRLPVTAAWLFLAGVANPPAGLTFCMETGVDCNAAAVSVWQQIQAAAEGAYDRTAACSFTSFVGYEHTASPAGRHLHRNVIFRNEHVPAFAASQVQTAAGGIPQGLWTAVESDCLNAGTGCDAVLIPHNSNLSNGQQFFDPADANEARRRQGLEPLVEIFQQKGGSECRFDRLAGVGAGTADELCTFEQLLEKDDLPSDTAPPIDQYPARNMVRNALKDGLGFEQQLGVNPFKFGFVADTDTHNATAGNTDEGGWVGSQGNTDSSPARQISETPRNNPGGLTAVWAEENSRDALFAGLRRRETYATSGTRPMLRFFGGLLADVSCDRGDFVEKAYETGATMGGDVGPQPSGMSPSFAVLAVKDAGSSNFPGTDLQRVQIVKGWVDAAGATHEKVFDVAGDANNGATVDQNTCEPMGAGAAQLCTVWTDPEFDATQRAFYYARLLENPTCRWSTRVCKSVGVDPFSPDCAAQAAAVDTRLADCCISENADPFLSPLIQERAWSSPIWYRPEAIAGVHGQIDAGATAGILSLDIRIGALPAGLTSNDLTLNVTDDDEIFHLTLPAGSFQSDGTGSHFTLSNAAAQSSGLQSASIEISADGEAHLVIQTQPTDLTKADRISHDVVVSLQAGNYETSHTRLWKFDGNQLVVAD